jgi:catechol 2,3-dioxygenase-like lactoylglutathione lyase family enzyme
MRVADLDRACGFYMDVLGLEPHPEKTNWLGFGQGCPIHLMERTLSDGVASCEVSKPLW